MTEQGGKYRFAAHPTWFKGVLFRSRLEARWAAFFELAGWKWQYEPFDLPGWTPDFLVEFPCGHSECGPTHTLLVEVKPYASIGEFKGHPCMDYPYGGYQPDAGGAGLIPADASAAFGNSPDVTWWEFGHGSGGGQETVDQWVGDLDAWELWNEAGRLTRYQPRG